MNGWISVKDRLPENDDSVLIVKQLKDGTRNIAIGYCVPDWRIHNAITGEDRTEPRWVCGGNNNVIYWQPLPDMPTE